MAYSGDRRRRLDGRKRAKNKDRRRNQARGAGAHWFKKAENLGIYHDDSKEDEDRVKLSGRIEGFKIRLSRPKVANDALDQPVEWHIELDAPRVCPTLVIKPRDGWSLGRIFSGDGYTTDHEDFDRTVAIEGESDMLLPILTHRVRLMLMGWIERGGAMGERTLSWSFDDEPFAPAVLSRCRRLTGIARRLSLPESARRKRSLQIAVYDPIPGVRLRALRALIAESDTMDEALAQALDVAWEPVGGEYSAIAFDDFVDLLDDAQDAIAHFSIPTVLALLETSSGAVKIAALNRLGAVGNRAHLARLTELSSGFFQWASVKDAARSAAQRIIERGGADIGGLTMVETSIEGRLALIPHLDGED